MNQEQNVALEKVLVSMMKTLTVYDKDTTLFRVEIPQHAGVSLDYGIPGKENMVFDRPEKPSKAEKPSKDEPKLDPLSVDRVIIRLKAKCSAWDASEPNGTHYQMHKFSFNDYIHSLAAIAGHPRPDNIIVGLEAAAVVSSLPQFIQCPKAVPAPSPYGEKLGSLGDANVYFDPALLDRIYVGANSTWVEGSVKPRAKGVRVL